MSGISPPEITTLRGIPEGRVAPARGTIKAVGLEAISVSLRSSGQTLTGVPVVGGASGLSVGDEVWLLFLDNRPFALSTVGLANGAYSGGGAAHSHDDRYYTESEADNLLALKVSVGDSDTGSDHISADSGYIAGWRFEIVGGLGTIFSSDYMTQLSSDGRIVLGNSAANETAVLDGNDATYRIWIGNFATPATAPFYVTKAGVMRASGATFDGTVEAGGELQSTNFSAGVRGWQITGDGDAEFNNVTVRGSLSTAVFQKDLISATAGSIIVAKSASPLAVDCKVQTTIATGNYYGFGGLTYSAFSVEVEKQAGGSPFASGDIVRLSDGVSTTWATVDAGVAAGNNWRYAATYQSGSTGVTYAAGLTVVDYGASGQGFLYMTSDNIDGPFYSVRTHAGSPWTTVTERLRLGNLRNSYGVGANERYGIGIGDYAAGNYLLYNPTDGFKIKSAAGDLTIDAGGIALLLAAVTGDQKHSYSFDNSSGVEAGGMYGWAPATSQTISVRTLQVSGKDSTLGVESFASSGQTSNVDVKAYDDSGAGLGISIVAPPVGGVSTTTITTTRTEVAKFFNIHAVSTLVIDAIGVVTATGSHHSIDTYTSAITDDLDTINGGAADDILILKPADDARTVVVKNGTGNILLAGADFSMDNILDRLLLIRGTTNWVELSRSNNGA